ncbi:unnamed protein product [Cladocopium goreaui]|uniref:Uncharacterized protein n=1 Tax=Cladocopium goreaui TaxID=2562237 RepID=A0A9P1C4W9_9DINO|nr:unnamed protein product [Cladocopium goreaui]
MQTFLEAVLLAHESLLGCCRKQGFPVATLPHTSHFLQLLPLAVQSTAGRRSGLQILCHLAEEMPAELRSFLATDEKARACAVELVNAGIAGSKVQRQAAEKVRSIL